jgi:probable addiction module antidote protein
MSEPLTINIPEGFSRWDAADTLKTDQDATLYFEACLQEDPGDGSLIRAALGDIARARHEPACPRNGPIAEGLHQALSAKGNPEFGTVMKVVRALGLKLHAETAHA